VLFAPSVSLSPLVPRALWCDFLRLLSFAHFYYCPGTAGSSLAGRNLWRLFLPPFLVGVVSRSHKNSGSPFANRPPTLTNHGASLVEIAKRHRPNQVRAVMLWSLRQRFPSKQGKQRHRKQCNDLVVCWSSARVSRDLFRTTVWMDRWSTNSTQILLVRTTLLQTDGACSWKSYVLVNVAASPFHCYSNSPVPNWKIAFVLVAGLPALLRICCRFDRRAFLLQKFAMG